MKIYNIKISKEMTFASETSTRLHLLKPYCQGNGVDIGSQGSPVNINSIQIEFDRSRFEEDVPIQWEGDGISNLPFKNNVLDYVYSSHLIEDYEDWTSILNEWNRVIKIGGYIVIMVPDHNKFRECVSKGQPDNLNHKHESYPGELSSYYKKHFLNFDIICDYITDSYNILFVAKKTQ
jgi:predicted SAM-dependent methyltransferase